MTLSVAVSTLGWNAGVFWKILYSPPGAATPRDDYFLFAVHHLGARAHHAVAGVDHLLAIGLRRLAVGHHRLPAVTHRLTIASHLLTVVAQRPAGVCPRGVPRAPTSGEDDRGHQDHTHDRGCPSLLHHQPLLSVNWCAWAGRRARVAAVELVQGVVCVPGVTSYRMPDH